MRDSTTSRRLTRLGIAVLLVLYGAPVIWMLSASLKSDRQIVTSPARIVFTPDLGGFRDVIDSATLGAMRTSAQIALASTALILVLAVPAAYGLARAGYRWTTFVLGGLVLLQMTPQATSVIPLYRILGQVSLIGSQSGVIVADTALLLPFAILLLRPFFLGIPREIEEASDTDGASSLRTFFEIVVPLARNGVVTVALFVFIIVWGEFLYAVSFITEPDGYPISAAISQQVSQFGVSWNRLMALSVVASVPILVVFLAGQRRLVAGLSMGATK